MNSEGVHSSFTYLERSGAGFNRTAWLTNCKVVLRANLPTGTPVSLRVVRTDDSKWKVREPSGRVSPDAFDWLTYLGTNGTVYKARVKCEVSSGDPITIYTKFEEKSEDGRQHKDKIDTIEVVDWDGSKWKVEVLDVGAEEGQPEFRLTRLS